MNHGNKVRGQPQKPGEESRLLEFYDFTYLFSDDKYAAERTYVRELLWYIVSWRMCAAFAPSLRRKLLLMLREVKTPEDEALAKLTATQLQLNLGDKVQEWIFLWPSFFLTACML